MRQYHKDFYRIDNLCVIINGRVDAEEVFKALKSFEERVVSKVSNQDAYQLLVGM